jgi:hypothetical protein
MRGTTAVELGMCAHLSVMGQGHNGLPLCPPRENPRGVNLRKWGSTDGLARARPKLVVYHMYITHSEIEL